MIVDTAMTLAEVKVIRSSSSILWWCQKAVGNTALVRQIRQRADLWGSFTPCRYPKKMILNNMRELNLESSSSMIEIADNYCRITGLAS